MGFENPANHTFEDLFTDVDAGETMFRVVVKSNLTRSLAEDLTEKLTKVLDVLDSMDSGYQSLRSRAHSLRTVDEDVPILMGGRMLPKNSSLNKSTFLMKSFKKTNKTNVVTQSIC